MKAMTTNTIIASAKAKGYNAETKDSGKVFNGKPRFDIVKHICPDCKEVFTKWAKDGEPVPASYTKAVKLHNATTKDTIIACQCGYRKLSDRVVHSDIWLTVFPPQTATDKVKKTGKTKSTKAPKGTKRGF